MSVERLPNVNSTPTFYLHKLLEDAGQIESICAIVKWKDGTFQASWTAQKMSDLAMCLTVAICDLPPVIKGDTGEFAPVQPGVS